MIVSQLKATDKPGDNSEFDNNVDAETRGGNPSSHGESKHYGTASAGFNQSSIVGGHMTAGGADAAGNNSSGVKAGNYLNAPTAWESDTSNSVMHQQFSGLHVLKRPGLSAAGYNFANSSPGNNAI